MLIYSEHDIFYFSLQDSKAIEWLIACKTNEEQIILEYIKSYANN